MAKVTETIEFELVLDKANADLKKFKSAFEFLDKPIKIEIDAKGAVKQLKSLEKEISKIDTSIAVGVTLDTKDAKKKAKDLKKEIKIPDVKVGIELDTGGVVSEAQQIQSLLKFDDVEVDTTSAVKELDKLDDKAGNIGLSLRTIGTGLAVGGLIAGIGGIVNAGAEMESTLAKVQAQTGKTDEEILKLKESSQEIFNAGVGEDVASVLDSLGFAEQQFKSIKDELGQPLEIDTAGFVQGAGAIAKVFDKDINEVIEKSRTSIQAFGLEGSQGIEFVSAVLKNAPFEDSLDTLNEYAPLMKSLGAGAEEFGTLLERGFDAGIRNSDILADSIKEAGIRINAGDFTTALDELGATANKTEKTVVDAVAKALESAKAGDISIVDAMGLSAEAIKKGVDTGSISDSLAQSLQVAVAGTPAEEIGVQAFSDIFSAPIPTGLIEQKGKEASEALGKAIEPKGFEGLQRAFQTLVGTLADTLLPVLQPIINLLQEQLLPVAGELLQSLTPLINLLGDTLGQALATLIPQIIPLVDILASKLVPVMNDIVAEAMPVFVELLGALVPVIGTLLQAMTPLIGILIKLVNLVSGILIKSVTALIKGFKDWIAEFKGAGKAFDEIITKIKAFSDGISDVSGIVSDFFGIGGEDETKDAIDDVDESTKQLTESTKELVTEEEAQAKAEAERLELMAGLTKTTQTQTKATKELSEAEKKRLENLKTSKGVLEEYLKLSDKTSKEALKLANAYITLRQAEEAEAKFRSSAKKSLEDRYLAITGLKELEKSSYNQRAKLQKEAQKEETEARESHFGNEYDAISGDLDKLLGLQLENGITIKDMQGETFEEILEKDKEFGIARLAEQQTYNDAMAGMQLQLLGTVSDAFEGLITGQEGVKEQFLNGLLGILDGMIPVLVAQITGLSLASPESVATAGVAGFAKASALTLILKGLVATARSTIGAEDGVIGIQQGYNTKAGATDTIPLWVAPDESIIKASSSKKHKGLLQLVNDGADENQVMQYLTSKNGNDNQLNTILSGSQSVRAVNPTMVKSDNTAIVGELRALRVENAKQTEQLRILQNTKLQTSTFKLNVQDKTRNKVKITEGL